MPLFAGLYCYHGPGDYLDGYPEIGEPLPPPANVGMLTTPVKVLDVDDFNTMLYLQRHQTLLSRRESLDIRAGVLRCYSR